MMIDTLAYYFILPVLSIAMLLIFIRVIKGPSLMDRVVALDLLVIVSIAVLSVYAILFDKKVMINIALVLGLITFLSTVGFTYYYIKGKREKDNFDIN
jgi:multicomponent Na+:H+ antiporter subunit F